MILKSGLIWIKYYMNICEKDTLANETWVFVDILKQKFNFARARTRAQIVRS